MMGDLHNKWHLSSYLDARRKDFTEKINRMEITSSTNFQSIIDRFAQDYRLEPLSVGEATASSHKETTIKKRDYRDFYEVKAFEITATIPIAGHHNLWFCMPDTSRVIYLDDYVTFGSTSVIVKVVLEQLDENKYLNTVDRVRQSLLHNIPAVNHMVDLWNTGLVANIQEVLEKRKGAVSEIHGFLDKIGLSVNPQSTNLVPPTVKKAVIPVPITATNPKATKEQIVLSQREVYTDIKNVLNSVGTTIERKPSIYTGKDEEALRDIFLLFLETRYDSTVGVSEAFNRKGKTDILLKYTDGTIIFVAECKVWKGKAEMMKAIGQLLGYVTPKDAQTALIFFVHQKDVTAITETMKEEIKAHPNYVRHIKDTFEHSINYEFTSLDDNKKRIQIEVMFFHFPPIK